MPKGLRDAAGGAGDDEKERDSGDGSGGNSGGGGDMGYQDDHFDRGVTTDDLLWCNNAHFTWLAVGTARDYELLKRRLLKG